MHQNFLELSQFFLPRELTPSIFWPNLSQHCQYQTHSTYKSYNTVKKLVICTKSGSISYISDAHAGLATDRFITENTNIAAQFTPAYFVLFHKGFNVHDLFL